MEFLYSQTMCCVLRQNIVLSKYSSGGGYFGGSTTSRLMLKKLELALRIFNRRVCGIKKRHQTRREIFFTVQMPASSLYGLPLLGSLR